MKDSLTALIIVLTIVALYYVMKYVVKSNFSLLPQKKKVVLQNSTMSGCGVPFHSVGCGCGPWKPPAQVYNIAGSGKDIIVSPFTGPSFYSAHQNNTLEQRPGNYSTLITYADMQDPPAAVIKLIYQKGCEKHPLVPLFWHLKDQYDADETSASSRIKFVAEIADPLDPYNWNATSAYGPFPKILKYKPNGQILEYQGYSDFGPLVDWIRDDSILFNGPYY